MKPASVTPAKRRKPSVDSDEMESSSGPQSKTRKRIPSDIWESKRQAITKLYQEEKRPLKEVMEIMERDYKFVATYVPPRTTLHCRILSQPTNAPVSQGEDVQVQNMEVGSGQETQRR